MSVEDEALIHPYTASRASCTHSIHLYFTIVLRLVHTIEFGIGWGRITAEI